MLLNQVYDARLSRAISLLPQVSSDACHELVCSDAACMRTVLTKPTQYFPDLATCTVFGHSIQIRQYGSELQRCWCTNDDAQFETIRHPLCLDWCLQYVHGTGEYACAGACLLLYWCFRIVGVQEDGC